MLTAQTRLIERNLGQARPFADAGKQVRIADPASVVEKETGKSDEAHAGRFRLLNRLKRACGLQSDPTIVYGLYRRRRQAEGPGRIYQVRHREGNALQHLCHRRPAADPDRQPGRAALEAVANPSRTNYFYFVADGTGGHVLCRDAGRAQCQCEALAQDQGRAGASAMMSRRLRGRARSGRGRQEACRKGDTGA